MTRTDGYLLADRVSLARIRFQQLGEFFKAKWPQDKGLILPKEPKDLFQTVIQPCLPDWSFFQGDSSRNYETMLSLDTWFGELQWTATFYCERQRHPSSLYPNRSSEVSGHWKEHIHSNQEHKTTDVFWLRAGSFCRTLIPCGKTRWQLGNVSLLSNFHFQI